MDEQTKSPPQSEWSFERNANGSFTIATMFNGRRVSHTFMGYSKREAIAIFREALRNCEA